MKLATEPRAVVIVATIGTRHLPECLASMSHQSYTNYGILVVDDSGGDEVGEFLHRSYPAVETLITGGGFGYRRGNSMAMRRVDADYVVVCNDDVHVERDWLARLVQALESDPRLGMVTPLILHYDRPDLVNAAGNTLHFTGMYGARGNFEPRERHDRAIRIGTVSGCCFAVRGHLLQRVGGFSGDFDELDTGFHASFEDMDLAWRVQLLGMEVGFVPGAVMKHKWVRKPITARWYGTYEWGRTLVTLRNFSWTTLFLLAPLLLVLEAASCVLAVAKGPSWLWAKLRIYSWLLTHPLELWRMRSAVQHTRKVNDHVILSQMSSTLRFVRSDNRVLRGFDAMVNCALRIYHGVLLRIAC